MAASKLPHQSIGMPFLGMKGWIMYVDYEPNNGIMTIDFIGYLIKRTINEPAARMGSILKLNTVALAGEK
ncbi:hypothetical protein VSA01S_11410 [Vibrio sagamiensis NBRC 104589]|uniref:Uncharacterized protein n=1 Tax=Vibrio sagamiensis NBRC 104589 TaxID=1219064 RepID=A0A511QCL2_9VIBR|nr:hypothetical protein VSA01S_11410 [Vibrio sagamiensis NBRC 104589]